MLIGIDSEMDSRAAMVTLGQIHDAVESREDEMFGPVNCYVVNFWSEYPAARRYSYKACGVLKPNGVPCSKSVEGHSALCFHNPVGEGMVDFHYRFDLYFTDARNGGQPLRACIFNEARKLLDLSPGQFHGMVPKRQTTYLHTLTTGMPLVIAWFRTYSDGRVVVHRLEKVVTLDSPPPVESLRTRGIGRSPVPAGTSSATRSSTTKAKGRMSMAELDVDAVHHQLAETMEMLATLKVRQVD